MTQPLGTTTQHKNYPYDTIKRTDRVAIRFVSLRMHNTESESEVDCGFGGSSVTALAMLLVYPPG